MKRKVFLMLAVAMFALAACVKESNGDRVAPEGEAWMALTINTPTQTRALNSPDNQYGTEEESYVENVLVFSFKGGLNPECVGVHKFEWEKSTPTIVSKPFLVPGTTEQILVVLNHPNIAKFIGNDYESAVGENFNDINAALTVDVADVIGSGLDHFMMTNSRGILEPVASTHLKTSEMAAMHSPLSLYVDRVVAKVRVYGPTYASRTEMPVFKGGDNGNINWDTAQWGLNVTNKKFFPVSARTMTANNYGGITGVWNDRYSLGGYRIDPNYTENENPAFGGGDFTEYDANFNWAGGLAVGNKPIEFKNFTNDGTGDDTIVEYCLENTFEAASSFHAWTTQVVVKVQLEPFDEDESFVSLLGQVFNAAELQALVDDYDNLTPEEFEIMDLFSEFVYAMIEQSFFDQLGDETMQEIFAELERISSDDQGLSNGIVNFYYHGWNYYKIMIKHDDYTTAYNQLGEFGVVRNSVYDININGEINNPGYPVIPDPDPKTPDETEERWLAVKISINPWTWYTQEETLE